MPSLLWQPLLVERVYYICMHNIYYTNGINLEPHGCFTRKQSCCARVYGKMASSSLVLAMYNKIIPPGFLEKRCKAIDSWKYCRRFGTCTYSFLFQGLRTRQLHGCFKPLSFGIICCNIIGSGKNMATCILKSLHMVCNVTPLCEKMRRDPMSCLLE